jgi:hypothetical protein
MTKELHGVTVIWQKPCKSGVPLAGKIVSSKPHAWKCKFCEFKVQDNDSPFD